MLTPSSCPFPAGCILSKYLVTSSPPGFSSITSSNVMRNVTSFRQSISFSDNLWPITQTAKMDEFFGIAEGTKVIMVLGHSNCGAVKATIDGKAVHGGAFSYSRKKVGNL